MADVKCSRCDRYYSVFRSRCPYCGTLRSSKGKKATNSNNAKWKVIFGVTLLLVLIGAVAAILVTTYFPKETTDPGTTPDIQNPDASGVVTQEGDIEPVMSPNGVSIAYGDSIRTDITIGVNESIKLNVMFDPWDYSGGCIWTTSDPNVITVAQDGTVMAIGAGTATLIVTAGEKTGECIVRVN